jgi:hypothetical protein
VKNKRRTNPQKGPARQSIRSKPPPTRRQTGANPGITPDPDEAGPGAYTKTKQKPQAPPPNQPRRPAQEATPRIKWHQKLGTLLSSQRTDTHQQDPGNPLPNPHRGNLSNLTKFSEPVNFARSPALRRPARPSWPPGRSVTDDCVTGSMSKDSAPWGSASRNLVPLVRASRPVQQEVHYVARQRSSTSL